MSEAEYSKAAQEYSLLFTEMSTEKMNIKNKLLPMILAMVITLSGHAKAHTSKYYRRTDRQTA